MDIVIIEKNEEIAVYIEEILLNTPSLQDATIARASDGKQGRKILGSCKPALIMLDVTLPDEKGVEFVREIRQTYPNSPLIAIASVLEPADLARLREAKVHTVVFKPVVPETIYKVILSILDPGAKT